MQTGFENSSGLTVAELKRLLADWPEVDEHGDPAEVWMMTGESVSSPVVAAIRLNRVDIVFEAKR